MDSAEHVIFLGKPRAGVCRILMRLTVKASCKASCKTFSWLKAILNFLASLSGLIQTQIGSTEMALCFASQR
jgi:hypothetical protein